MPPQAAATIRPSEIWRAAGVAAPPGGVGTGCVLTPATVRGTSQDALDQARPTPWFGRTRSRSALSRSAPSTCVTRKLPTAALPASHLSTARRHHVEGGAQAARGVVERVFPPRAEDTGGSLALTTAELLANTELRRATARLAKHRRERLWWLEGFLAGFASEAVAALGPTGPHDDITHDGPLFERTAREHLHDMEASVAHSLQGETIEASALAFSLARAIDAHDDLTFAWALEDIWTKPGHQPRVEPGEDTLLAARAAATQMFAHYRAALNAAVAITSAAWKLRMASLTPPATGD